MLYFLSGSILASIQFLSLLLLSKAGLAMALLVWHHTTYIGGVFRFNRVKHTVPFLLLDLRTRLNWRYWMVRLSRLALCTNYRDFFLPVAGPKFLLHRDGRHIFDFFNILALSDVSPPALA